MAKKILTRIQHKTDTSANWARAVNFVPLAGELIVYQDLHKLKIGDGTTTVGNLPFVTTDKFSYAFSEITGKPTTLSGYGITDGYTKPSGGIPKTDLASGVQTSLGKADTALQSFTETDPTVPSWAKASTKPSYNFSEIGSRGESYLAWGGKNLAADYSPIDAALVGNLGANRTAFLKPSGVTVEYSRDGGTSWADYGSSDSAKKALFTTSQAHVIGKSSSSNPVNKDCMLRVTVRPMAAGVYSNIRKHIIYLSTEGASGSYCTIRARKQSDVTAGNDNWHILADKVAVAGWSGYNVINTSEYTWYGNSSYPNAQYGEVQFIFGITSISSTYKTGLTIYSIYCYGGVGWTTNSTLAKTGNLYSYDAAANATFPANITASKLIKSGGTSAQFLKADGSVDSNTYLTTSGKASDADKLDGQDGTYYLNYNNFSNKPTIPTKTSDLTNDSGFTTNTGTVTSVAVKMNGATKGTVTGAGEIDLGTVLTEHQDISGKLDKNTSVTSVDQLYVKRANGTNNMIEADATYWSPSTVAKRSSDGNILVAATPTHNNHCTSKKYVDDGLAAKQNTVPATGSAAKPIYFSANGTVAACTHSLNEDVPAGAVFTDTNYYHTPQFTSGVNIGTGTGVNNLYVPNGTTSQAGAVKLGASGGAATYSHSHSNYMPKTGGTFTGAITAPTVHASSVEVDEQWGRIGNGRSYIQFYNDEGYMYSEAAGGEVSFASIIYAISGCVTTGTKITMADGSLKNVEDIVYGDEVLSYDLTNNKPVPAVVLLNIPAKPSRHMRQNIFEDGTILNTVDEHYVYNPDGNPVSDIQEYTTNDYILKQDGSKVKYQGYYTYTDDNIESYNLLTSNNLYYAEGVLNSCLPPSKFHHFKRLNIKMPDSLRSAVEQELNYSREGGHRSNNPDFLREVVELEGKSHRTSEIIREKKEALNNSDWSTIKLSEKVITAVADASDFLDFKTKVKSLLEEKAAADLKRREEERAIINEIESSYDEYHKQIIALKRKYGVLTEFEDASLQEQFKICNKLGNDNYEAYRTWIRARKAANVIPK